LPRPFWRPARADSQMEMIQTKCAICGSTEDYVIVYKSNASSVDLNAEIFSARRMPDAIHYQIVRCKNDNLVRSNPIHNSPSIKDLYKCSTFTYTDQIDNLACSYLRALDEVLPLLAKDARMLEVGCGNGFVLKALRGRGYRNVVGIEPSADAVARAEASIRDNITVDFLKEGIYESGSFDLIFFFQTLDHIYDPVHFLAVCRDLLAPEGLILAFNHDVESFSARLLGEKSPIIDIEHPYLYSKETIRRLLRKCGFTPLKIYSPGNVISVKHLLRLIPFLPKAVKMRLLNANGGMLARVLNVRLRVRLGNLCVIASKSVPTEE